MEENLSELFVDTKLKKINDFLAYIESFYAFIVVLVGLIGNSISFYLFVSTKLRFVLILLFLLEYFDSNLYQ
jgi:hypothetical protein